MTVLSKETKSEGQTYAYVRVSTADQNEDRQLDAMHKLGINDKHIFVEKKSGKDFERPQYKKMVKKLKEGDILYIMSIDRLGRNYDEIREQWRILTKVKNINIVVLDMPLLDTRQFKDLVGTLISDLVLELLAYVAESERVAIRTRTNEGIAAAKARGVRFGRPPIEFGEEFKELYSKWKNGELTMSEAARSASIPRSTLQYRIKAYEKCFFFRYKERRLTKKRWFIVTHIYIDKS